MMSTGRAEGQPGACVRGYMRVYHEAASRSKPFSFGSTTCRGVPAAHDLGHKRLLWLHRSEVQADYAPVRLKRELTSRAVEVSKTQVKAWL